MKAICKNGHPLTYRSTRIRPDGRQECKTCSQDRWREYYYRNHARMIERGRKRWLQGVQRMSIVGVL